MRSRQVLICEIERVLHPPALERALSLHDQDARYQAQSLNHEIAASAIPSQHHRIGIRWPAHCLKRGLRAFTAKTSKHSENFFLFIETSESITRA